MTYLHTLSRMPGGKDEPEAKKRRQDHDMNNLKEQVTIKCEMFAASNELQVARLTQMKAAIDAGGRRAAEADG